MELIPPAPHFLNSYLEACQETWGHVHSTYILHDPSQYARWKDTIFQQFENEKRGIGLPPGYVPSTTFWLICGERFIGSGNIRHFLNASLREYGGQIGDFIRLSERGKGYGSLLLRMLLSKAEIMRAARQWELPVFSNPCPSAGKTKRADMMDVLDAMCAGSKVRRKNIFNGLARWQWEQNRLAGAVIDGDGAGDVE